MMKKYQCILMFNPTLDDDALTKAITSFEELITNNGGIVQQKSIPKKIEMGYRIKKKKDSYYVLVDFELEPQKVKGIDSVLRLNETILRFTIVVKKEKETLR